jgi:branched-chain amino acid transport system permease protein
VKLVIQDVINAVSLGSLYALIALGVALLFSIMRLANFAHGEIIAVSAFAMLALSGLPVPVWILGTLAAGVLVALLMERIAFRPVRGKDMTTMLITAFAVSFAVKDLLLFSQGALPKPVRLPGFFSGTVEVAGLQIAANSLVSLAASAVLLTGLVVFFQKTDLGVQMRAAADDFGMARLLGVRANLLIAAAFAISGLLAAVAAILLVSQSGSVEPYMGFAPVIVGFVACVIGGMGSLKGAAVGGMLLGCLTVLLQATLPDGLAPYRDAFLYSLVIAILVVRPQGLFASPAVVEDA